MLFTLMMAFLGDPRFLLFLMLIILLSGDVNENPGPASVGQRQCQLLYSNIRGLHGNLNDLIATSKQYDILFCSETLVSNFRSSKELLIPGFEQPLQLRRRRDNWLSLGLGPTVVISAYLFVSKVTLTL